METGRVINQLFSRYDPILLINLEVVSDKTYGEMLEIEYETMQTAEKQDGYGRMVGKYDNCRPGE